MTNPGAIGTWRILEMELWDEEYMDLVVPAYMRFDEDGLGEFQFGAVHGWIDYRIETEEMGEYVEFSWEGENDTDHVCGRGWALCGSELLRGRLFFHNGDDSGFTAKKQAT
jgi:hypothetical protein